MTEFKITRVLSMPYIDDNVKLLVSEGMKHSLRNDEFTPESMRKLVEDYIKENPRLSSNDRSLIWEGSAYAIYEQDPFMIEKIENPRVTVDFRLIRACQLLSKLGDFVRDHGLWTIGLLRDLAIVRMVIVRECDIRGRDVRILDARDVEKIDEQIKENEKYLEEVASTWNATQGLVEDSELLPMVGSDIEWQMPDPTLFRPSNQDLSGLTWTDDYLVPVIRSRAVKAAQNLSKKTVFVNGEPKIGLRTDEDNLYNQFLVVTAQDGPLHGEKLWPEILTNDFENLNSCQKQQLAKRVSRSVHHVLTNMAYIKKGTEVLLVSFEITQEDLNQFGTNLRLTNIKLGIQGKDQTQRFIFSVPLEESEERFLKFMTLKLPMVVDKCLGKTEEEIMEKLHNGTLLGFSCNNPVIDSVVRMIMLGSDYCRIDLPLALKIKPRRSLNYGEIDLLDRKLEEMINQGKENKLAIVPANNQLFSQRFSRYRYLLDELNSLEGFVRPLYTIAQEPEVAVIKPFESKIRPIFYGHARGPGPVE